MKSPTLILGWIPRIVTPIARSLNRHGIPVDVVDFFLAPRIHSRAIRNFKRLPSPYYSPSEFLDSLRQFIKQHGHDMLIPTDDLALAAVVEHYDELKALLYIACPPPAVTRLVLDKTSTLDLAQKVGIRIPLTVTVRNSGQLIDFAEQVPFPWVLKPAEKVQRSDEFKSCTIANRDEISKQFPQFCEFTPPMLLQEYCPGSGVGIEMLMHKGKCMAVFQHRRLKELPYSGGVSVTAVAERPDSALVDSSLALLQALQWDGVAMVEFKINPMNGQTVLMEVNGRYWGTISLPLLAGADFPLYHWQLVHGEFPQTPTSYKYGTKWRWTVGYFSRLHGLLAAAHSSSARKELMVSLLKSPIDFVPFVRDALFELSDPIPAITELLRASQYYFWHDLKMLLKRSEPHQRALVDG